MTPRGIAIAMPIFKAGFGDPDFEAGGLGLGLVCVGTDALSAVDVVCVDVDLVGEELVEGTASLEETVKGNGVGWPVTTPREFVRLVKSDAGWSF